jgi:hypothetical protein
MAGGVGLFSGCSSAASGEADGSDQSSASTSALSEDTVTTAETTAYDFFVAKGLTAAQSAGIVGNLIQESNVEPGAVEPGGPGRGIAQWSVGGRWDTDSDDNVAWYAKKEGLSTTSLTLQLEFVWYELSTFSSYGLASLKKTTNVTDATVVFQTDFEGCGACDESERIAYAKAVLAALGGSGGTSGGGGSSGTGCYSSTLGREVVDNACVENSAGWWQCDNGTWVDRFTDPTACDGVYPD